MRFQSFLLVLIILISLLISGNFSTGRFLKINREKEINKTSPPTITLFLNDFYLVLSKKSAAAAQNLTAGVADATQKIAAINKILNQNLISFKQSLIEKRDNFFSELNSENASVIKYQNISEAALIAQENLDPPTMKCHLENFHLNVKAALIRDLDYPEVNIFEFNSSKRWPMASLTKLMTSVITIEKIGWDKELKMSEKAVATEGTAGDFQPGEIFKSGDLIKAMIISSSNDAAAAVAEDYNEYNFINAMQKKAAELKMFQTSYFEPTGLSFLNQSTADDLAKLAYDVYQKHPEILEISKMKEAEITELKSKKPRTILNIDKLAGEADFLGGKTGYTDEAGRNLIGFFNINDRKILTIVLGADDSFKETEKLKDLAKNCEIKF